jgi:hypothetical protein
VSLGVDVCPVEDQAWEVATAMRAAAKVAMTARNSLR